MPNTVEFKGKSVNSKFKCMMLPKNRKSSRSSKYQQKLTLFVIVFINIWKSSTAQDQVQELLNDSIKTWTLYTCCEYQSQFVNEVCSPSSNLFKDFPTSKLGSQPFQGRSIEINVKHQGLRCQESFTVTLRSDFFEDSSTNFNADDKTPKFIDGEYLAIDGHLYSINDICLNEFNNSSLKIEVCNNYICNETYPCLPVCCERPKLSQNKGLPSDKSTCPILVQLLNKTTGSVGDGVGLDSGNRDVVLPSSSTQSSIYLSKLSCIKQGRTISTNFVNTLDNLYENPSLVNGRDYCISFVSFNATSNGPLYEVSYCGDKWPYEEFGLTKLEAIIYGIFSIFSVIFTTFGMILYLILWKKQTVHSWTQFCLLVSLFGEYTCITIAIYFPAGPDKFCTLYNFLLVIIYSYFGVAIITFLAILSIDLLLSFWRLDPNVRQSGGNLRRFYIYATLGFGIPFLLILKILITALLQSKAPASSPWRKYCSDTKNPLAKLVMLIIVLLNLSSFIGTFILIMKHRRAAQFASQNASKQKNQLLTLFGKLFLITGITFSGVVVEILSESKLNTDSILLLTFRGIICLQGVVVFIVYLCNKKTWDQLNKRFPRFTSRLSTLSFSNFSSLMTNRTAVSTNASTPMEHEEMEF